MQSASGFNIQEDETEQTYLLKNTTEKRKVLVVGIDVSKNYPNFTRYKERLSTQGKTTILCEAIKKAYEQAKELSSDKQDIVIVLRECAMCGQEEEFISDQEMAEFINQFKTITKDRPDLVIVNGGTRVKSQIDLGQEEGRKEVIDIKKQYQSYDIPITNEVLIGHEGLVNQKRKVKSWAKQQSGGIIGKIRTYASVICQGQEYISGKKYPHGETYGNFSLGQPNYSDNPSLIFQPPEEADMASIIELPTGLKIGLDICRDHLFKGIKNEIKEKSRSKGANKPAPTAHIGLLTSDTISIMPLHIPRKLSLVQVDSRQGVTHLQSKDKNEQVELSVFSYDALALLFPSPSPILESVQPVYALQFKIKNFFNDYLTQHNLPDFKNVFKDIINESINRGIDSSCDELNVSLDDLIAMINTLDQQYLIAQQACSLPLSKAQFDRFLRISDFLRSYMWLLVQYFHQVYPPPNTYFNSLQEFQGKLFSSRWIDEELREAVEKVSLIAVKELLAKGANSLDISANKECAFELAEGNIREELIEWIKTLEVERIVSNEEWNAEKYFLSKFHTSC